MGYLLMSIGKDCGKKMKIKPNKKVQILNLIQHPKNLELSSLKGGLVIYFYLKDNTPGCTWNQGLLSSIENFKV